MVEDRQLAVTGVDDLAEVEVPCDAQRVSQVLVNLLENAAKFSPAPGTVGVELRLLRELPEWIPARERARLRSGVGAGGAFALLAVCDAGPGVPESERRRVFEQFVQTEAGRGVRNRGVGLGLAICREIVALHGGTIGVTDCESGGSRFYTVLPDARSPRRARHPMSLGGVA